jgi:hypothetical protein
VLDQKLGPIPITFKDIQKQFWFNTVRNNNASCLVASVLLKFNNISSICKT